MRDKIYYNSIKEIENAINNGKRVYYKNTNYEVVKSAIGVIVYCAMTNFSGGFLKLYSNEVNNFFSLI